MEAIAQDSPAPVDPMVYRDLLIFEESLRSQYLYLQKRRRKYLSTLTSFVLVLMIVFLCGILVWLAYFTYGTIFAPSQVHIPDDVSMLTAVLLHLYIPSPFIIRRT